MSKCASCGLPVDAKDGVFVKHPIVFSVHHGCPWPPLPSKPRKESS